MRHVLQWMLVLVLTAAAGDVMAAPQGKRPPTIGAQLRWAKQFALGRYLRRRIARWKNAQLARRVPAMREAERVLRRWSHELAMRGIPHQRIQLTRGPVGGRAALELVPGADHESPFATLLEEASPLLVRVAIEPGVMAQREHDSRAMYDPFNRVLTPALHEIDIGFPVYGSWTALGFGYMQMRRDAGITTAFDPVLLSEKTIELYRIGDRPTAVVDLSLVGAELYGLVQAVVLVNNLDAIEDPRLQSSMRDHLQTHVAASKLRMLDATTLAAPILHELASGARAEFSRMSPYTRYARGFPAGSDSLEQVYRGYGWLYLRKDNLRMAVPVWPVGRDHVSDRAHAYLRAATALVQDVRAFVLDKRPLVEVEQIFERHDLRPE